MYTLLSVKLLIETIYDLLNRNHSGCELINYDGLRIHICLINDAKQPIVNSNSRWKTETESKSKSYKAWGNEIRHDRKKVQEIC